MKSKRTQKMNNLSAHQLPPPPQAASLTQQFCLRWHNHQVNWPFYIAFFFACIHFNLLFSTLINSAKVNHVRSSVNTTQRDSNRFRSTHTIRNVYLFFLLFISLDGGSVFWSVVHNTKIVQFGLTEHENQRDNLFLFHFDRITGVCDSALIRLLFSLSDLFVFQLDSRVSNSKYALESDANDLSFDVFFLLSQILHRVAVSLSRRVGVPAPSTCKSIVIQRPPHALSHTPSHHSRIVTDNYFSA